MGLCGSKTPWKKLTRSPSVCPNAVVTMWCKSVQPNIQSSHFTPTLCQTNAFCTFVVTMGSLCHTQIAFYYTQLLLNCQCCGLIHAGWGSCRRLPTCCSWLISSAVGVLAGTCLVGNVLCKMWGSRIWKEIIVLYFPQRTWTEVWGRCLTMRRSGYFFSRDKHSLMTSLIMLFDTLLDCLRTAAVTNSAVIIGKPVVRNSRCNTCSIYIFFSCSARGNVGHFTQNRLCCGDIHMPEGLKTALKTVSTQELNCAFILNKNKLWVCLKSL